MEAKQARITLEVFRMKGVHKWDEKGNECLGRVHKSKEYG